jgi:hypothetical protein
MFGSGLENPVELQCVRVRGEGGSECTSLSTEMSSVDAAGAVKAIYVDCFKA